MKEEPFIEKRQEIENSIEQLKAVSEELGLRPHHPEHMFIGQIINTIRLHADLVLKSRDEMKACVQELSERSNDELQKIRESGQQHLSNLSRISEIFNKIEAISVNGIEKQYETAILGAVQAMMPVLEEPLKEQCQMFLDNQALNLLKRKTLIFGVIILLFSFMGYGLRGCVDSGPRDSDVAIAACMSRPILTSKGQRVCDLDTLLSYQKTSLKIEDTHK